MTRTLLNRCGLTFVCLGLATLLTYLIRPLVHQESFTVFIAAVIVVAMYGGMGAALLTTLLSIFLVNFLWDVTPYHLDFDLPDLELALVFVLVSVVVSRLASSRNLTIVKLSRTNAELQEALAEVKTLRGILPICASCKKIRNSQGQWTDVAAYISGRTDAEFTHGMCQQCLERLYPEMYPTLTLREVPDAIAK